MTKHPLIFFDFEVFKHDWLVVFVAENGKSITIVNDSARLKRMYSKYKEAIFVGYNCRHYDQYIFKGIMLDMDPYEISRFIIESNEIGFKYSSSFGKVPLYIYDTMLKKIGLKTLEGFMGLNIKESPISFKLNRKLTKEELLEIEKYCKHDVLSTMEVFKHSIGEFNAHMSLLNMFNFNIKHISQTIANVAVSIFGSTYQDKILYHDEFDLDLPELPTLKKYRYVREWFEDPNNHSYKHSKINSRGNEMETKREFVTTIAGVEHIFAWGGVHASRNNEIFEGLIVIADVDGYYPNISTKYNTLSRNIPNMEQIKDLIVQRINFKAKKDKRQIPIKRALNSLYGKSKDKQSSAYDPRQANRTCVYGQLFILDLIELLEDHITLLNTNTDGIIFLVDTLETLDTVKELCKTWEDRTGFKLSFEICSKLIQKDVNNYILIKKNKEYDVINTMTERDIKSTGAYVKKLSDIDNDLPIINKALIEYFINDVPVEKTINNCDDLMQFQQLCKVSRKYLCALYNNVKLDERVFRVYATKEHGHTLFKLKEVIKLNEEYHEVFSKVKGIPDYTELASQMDIISMEKKKNQKTKYKPIVPSYAQKKYDEYNLGFRTEKIASTPMKCIIYNEDVRGKKVFENLDKDWYINVAKHRIQKFIGKANYE